MFALRVDQKEIPIQAIERPVHKSEASAAGMRFGFGTLGFALLTIFIPIVHFVSVPLGILLAPMIGFIVYKVYLASAVIEGDFQCASCQAEIHFVIDKSDKKLKCTKCNVEFEFLTSGL